MATSPIPVLVQAPKIGLVQIANADASTQKVVVTAGANGTKVVSLTAASSDTAARVLQISVGRGGTNYIIGSVSVPAGAGTNGTSPSVNLLASTLLPGLPVDNDGQPYVFLQTGDVLQVSSTTTVTSNTLVHLSAIEADF
jgi:hypothetical protein